MSVRFAPGDLVARTASDVLRGRSSAGEPGRRGRHDQQPVVDRSAAALGGCASTPRWGRRKRGSLHPCWVPGAGGFLGALFRLTPAKMGHYNAPFAELARTI